MKIQKAELKYFKFHTNLTVDFNAKNLLIYGENGTGKSSIYEALYSSFYHQKNLKATAVRDIYLSRNCPSEQLEVNITFDNSTVLNRRDDNLDSLNILNNGPISPTIYFANEKVLNRLTKENFYIALKDTLVQHFPSLKSLENIFQNKIEEVRRWKDEIKHEQKKPLKAGAEVIDYPAKIEEYKKQLIVEVSGLNELFKKSFDDEIPQNAINQIIKEKFDENSSISFDFQGAEIPTTLENIGLDFEINLPIIKIKVDDVECDGKLSHHFNEAKLKLIGVAIYFALAKKYEALGTGFKLLVLDDFLTSLDMANRKLIIKYILEEFNDYQKLILTHNLQFFNMARRMIHLDSNDAEQWKVQKLFVHENQAFLYDKDISYLNDATERLSSGDEHSAGNFIRKEFERIVTEFEQLLELGIVEESKNIINTLESQDRFYVNASENLNLFCENVQSALSCSDNEQQKLGYIKTALGKALQTQVNFEEKIKNPDGTESNITINTAIKKGKFYQNFILHPASHHDFNAEIYKKDCENAIKVLKYLNLIVNNLKGTKYF